MAHDFLAIYLCNQRAIEFLSISFFNAVVHKITVFSTMFHILVKIKIENYWEGENDI